MSTLLTTYLGKYIDDIASFVISHYRAVNGLHDYRTVFSCTNSSVLSHNHTRNYLIHPYAIRQATPNIKNIPHLPPQLVFMFDDITFQKISTLVWSATATFVLAFTARFISSRLHPQLKFTEVEEEERDPLLSLKDQLSSCSSSSKKAALISHQGKCMCGRVKFRVKAPSELHAILTDDLHPVAFPRIHVPSDDFVWLADAEALSMVGDNNNSEHDGMHFLCVECSVEVLYSPSANAATLEVNLECIDTTHVTRIHHHHISTVPQTPEPQTFRERLQFLQEQKQQSFQSSPPVDTFHQQHSSSPATSGVVISITPKHSHHSHSSRSNEPMQSEEHIKVPTPTTTRSVHSIQTQEHLGDDEFYGDEDDDDDDEEISPSNRNNQHFALNMQLNSLGHYSRNRRSHSPAENSRRSGQSPHARSNSRQKYNGMFFPSNNHSSQNLHHHAHSQQQYSRPQFVRHQHALDGNQHAHDSDTTEDMFFEQFFAPAAPFSPPPGPSISNTHNPAYYSDELQYILGADSATANSVSEILASQTPSVTHTPPRVTPNKTYRPISTNDLQTHGSHSMSQPRGGTPTSLESASSGHGSQAHSRSHSGTSSPASSLGSNSASGSSARRFHNYHHASEPSQMQQYAAHQQYQADHPHGDVSSPPMSQYVHRKRGSRSLAFTTSPMLVSEVLEQHQKASPVVVPLLKDEYGNELDIHESGMWFASAVAEELDGTSVSHQYQQHSHVSHPFPQSPQQYNYPQYQISTETHTSSLISPMEMSSLPTEHTSHSTHSDDMSSSTTPSTAQYGDLTSKEENDPTLDEDPSQRFPHVVDEGDDDDDSPSGLWQRRYVTMRRSTPGRLHSHSSSGGYSHPHSRTGTAGHKQRSSAAASFGPSRVSMVDKHSAAAAGVPLDMAMYQNLKRYMGRHLSPSNQSGAGKDKSVKSSDKEAVL